MTFGQIFHLVNVLLLQIPFFNPPQCANTKRELKVLNINKNKKQCNFYIKQRLALQEMMDLFKENILNPTKPIA